MPRHSTPRFSFCAGPQTPPPYQPLSPGGYAPYQAQGPPPYLPQSPSGASPYLPQSPPFSPGFVGAGTVFQAPASIGGGGMGLMRQGSTQGTAAAGTAGSMGPPISTPFHQAGAEAVRQASWSPPCGGSRTPSAPGSTSGGSAAGGEPAPTAASHEGGPDVPSPYLVSTGWPAWWENCEPARLKCIEK